VNDSLNIPEYLKKYISKLDLAYTEALKLDREAGGKVYNDGMHIVDKLDVAIDGNRWDEVKELEAKLDAICGPNLQRAALQIMLKHFAGLYDALCVLEDAALDEDGNHPDYISEIGTASLDLETVLMRCQYHFAAVSDDNDTLMEE
jgi:hypothetical protein